MAEQHKSWLQNSLFLVLILSFAIPILTEENLYSLQELKALVCGVDNFNTNNLTVPKIWSLDYGTNTSKCLTTNGTESKVTGCKFKFSFCHAFNCSTTNTSLMNTTACLATHVNETGDTQLKLGSYDVNVNPFENEKGVNDQFLAHFIKGGSYNTKSNKSCVLSMDIEFKCNRTALWKVEAAQLEAAIDPTYLTAISYNDTTCQYTLQFDYSGACPPEKKPESNALSAGSVMIILFFVGITIYFVVGGLIKFLSGHRGVEIIPNNEFWVALPVYIADGCLFTCRCGKKDSDSTSSKYDSI